jgi:hypothetical protein
MSQPSRDGGLALRLLCVAGFLFAICPDARAQEVRITGITFFQADGAGNLNMAGQWNTNYLDPAWDLAAFNWKEPSTINWAADLINAPSNYGVDIALAAGTSRTLGLCFAGGNFPNFFGMNLFFGGAQNPSPGTPGISVVAYTDMDGPGAGDPIAFNPIAPSVGCGGWPFSAFVGGSGSLVYLDAVRGVKVTMTDFAIYSPTAYNFDIVQQQDWAGGSGLQLTAGTDTVPDTFVKFTLVAESTATPPSSLACSRPGDGLTVDLSWVNGGVYSSLKVLRDGAEIASLAVDATSYKDENVPFGRRDYQVLAEFGGFVLGPSCSVADPAHGEVAITAMTFFQTYADGSLNTAGQWNTLYLDPAWDLALFDGPAPPTVPVAWLNDNATYAVDIRLLEGDEKTFGFAVSGVDPENYGLNLFFGGAQSPSPGTPGISVFAYSDTDGPGAGDPPAYNPIPTSVGGGGWPFSAPVAGTGSLVYLDAVQGVKVTMTSFAVYAPTSFNLDVVQKQDWAGGSGLRLTAAKDGYTDTFVQFTLKVESTAKAPSGLVCVRSQDGATADLSWVVEGRYVSLDILRDGAVLASLPVDATSYRDEGVPIGRHEYQVLAGFADLQTGPSCTSLDPTHGEVAITAMTFFGTDGQGSVNPSYRWNTLYLDAAWDIAVFAGAPPPALPVAWLNDLTNYGVDLPLIEGEEKTFTFVVSNVPNGFYGLNIFFEGAQDPTPGKPGISVFASTDLDSTEPHPAFQAIATTTNTMGWSIADVGGSGTLEYVDPVQGVRVMMTDFVVFSTAALNLDLVQPQEPGGRKLTEATDGAADLIGRFTLKVRGPTPQIAGDCNQDGAVDINDIICTIKNLFSGFLLLDRSQAIPPCSGDLGSAGNIAVLDVNGSGGINITDIVYLAHYLFMGGSEPAQGIGCLPLRQPAQFLNCLPNPGCP